MVDGKKFDDQSINDLIKQYDEIRKFSAGQGDDYTTGCWFDYVYLKNNYRLISVDLSKQKILDANSRAFQQMVFEGVAEGADNTKISLYTILEKSKETVYFTKEQQKFYEYINGNQIGVTLKMNIKMFNGNN